MSGGQRTTYRNWLSLYSVGSGDQNQVVRLEGKHLYISRHLIDSATTLDVAIQPFYDKYNFMDGGYMYC